MQLANENVSRSSVWLFVCFGRGLEVFLPGYQPWLKPLFLKGFEMQLRFSVQRDNVSTNTEICELQKHNRAKIAVAV